MNTEQLQIAVKIIEARDAAKAIAGDGYAKRVEVWKETVSDMSDTLNQKPLEALAWILQNIAANRDTYGELADMWACAATFELIAEKAREK